MQRKNASYWLDSFETILPVCSHIPHIWMLWSPNGKSENITYLGANNHFQLLTISVQFWLWHCFMQRAFAPSTVSIREKKSFLTFVPRKDIHGVSHDQWLHWWWKHFSSEKHDESKHIMSLASQRSGSLWPWPQSLLTCFCSQVAVITILDLSMQSQVFTVAWHSVILLLLLLLRKTHCIGLTSFPPLKNSSLEVSIAFNMRDWKMKE